VSEKVTPCWGTVDVPSIDYSKSSSLKCVWEHAFIGDSYMHVSYPRSFLFAPPRCPNRHIQVLVFPAIGPPHDETDSTHQRSWRAHMCAVRPNAGKYWNKITAHRVVRAGSATLRLRIRSTTANCVPQMFFCLVVATAVPK